jgi:hypothetical protein
VLTVRARIQTYSEIAPVVPIVIPDLDEVRKFAKKLHAAGRTWAGEVFGWSAEYSPERPEPPLDSKMTFTPADFSVGESGIWFFSMMWEHGRDKDPVEYLDDRNILRVERRQTHAPRQRHARGLQAKVRG